MNKPTHGGQIQIESIWISLGWRHGCTWGEMNAEGLYRSEVAIWAGGSFTRLHQTKSRRGFGTRFRVPSQNLGFWKITPPNRLCGLRDTARRLDPRFAERVFADNEIRKDPLRKISK